MGTISNRFLGEVLERCWWQLPKDPPKANPAPSNSRPALAMGNVWIHDTSCAETTSSRAYTGEFSVGHLWTQSPPWVGLLSG